MKITNHKANIHFIGEVALFPNTPTEVSESEFERHDTPALKAMFAEGSLSFPDRLPTKAAPGPKLAPVPPPAPPADPVPPPADPSTGVSDDDLGALLNAPTPEVK